MRRMIGTALVAGAIALSPAMAPAADGVSERTAKGSFAEARQALVDAIVNRGYKIDYEAFVGDMLTRTGEDVGSARPIYKDAQFVQFCSAVLSREAMEADASNLAYCPYVLFIYERADTPDEVRVGFRRLPAVGDEASKAALEKVNAVLDDIIEEAAAGW